MKLYFQLHCNSFFTPSQKETKTKLQNVGRLKMLISAWEKWRKDTYPQKKMHLCMLTSHLFLKKCCLWSKRLKRSLFCSDFLLWTFNQGKKVTAANYLWHSCSIFPCGILSLFEWGFFNKWIIISNNTQLPRLPDELLEVWWEMFSFQHEFLPEQNKTCGKSWAFPTLHLLKMSVVIYFEMVIGTYSKHVIKIFCLKTSNHNHFW